MRQISGAITLQEIKSRQAAIDPEETLAESGVNGC